MVCKFNCICLFLCVYSVISQTNPRFSKEAESEILNAQQEWLRSHEQRKFTQSQEDYLNSLSGVNNGAANEINLQVDSDVSTARSVIIRKEYRQMTISERDRFHQAIRAMHNDSMLIDGLTEFDVFVSKHNRASAPGAHRGDAFLPWHREYLLRFENALRNHDPTVYLPYWDCTLDHDLPNPQHSTIWESSLLGTKDGDVRSGAFKDWRVLDECATGSDNILRRDVSGRSIERTKELIINDDDVEYTLSLKSFSQLTNESMQPNIELYHNGLHLSVGGHMRSIQCSPSDPSFWLYHAFIDYIWERFRMTVQNSTSRTEYGYTGQQEYHREDDIMFPFSPLLNRDGLRDSYTESHYKYEDSPSTVNCSSDVDCVNTQYFWCRLGNTRGKCMAKATYGGNCSGLDDNACYKNSECIGDTCTFPEYEDLN